MYKLTEIGNGQMFAAKTQYGELMLFKACTDSYVNDHGVLCIDCTGDDDFIYTFDEYDAETLFRVVRKRIIGKSGRLKHLWVEPEDV